MSITSPLSFYLIVEKPADALTAQVNGAPSDPYMTISYDNATPGSITPLPGMSVWFGTTPGGQERGILRLRWWNGSNQISVAESDDVGPLIQNDDYITVKVQWRLWPKYPRALVVGDQAIILEDYDISFTDQTLKWYPVAVAGPPAVVELSGGTAVAQFVGDRSFAVASGASISSYLWTAPGSVEGSSASQGTEASPVTFTYTTAGEKLVYLTVTDSNGKQSTNYTKVWVVDPASPEDVAYLDFDAYNDNFDFEQGGGSGSFLVHGAGSVSDFPNEALVVLTSRPTTPGQTTPTGCWPNRTNVHFVGYVLGDTVRQNPIEGDISFQAASVDALMKNLTMFPVSLTFNNAPQNWTQAANLSPDRAAAFLWHYHSTLSLMAPIVPSNYTASIYRQDFGPGDLYSQLDSELLQTMWGRVVINHQGIVHHLIDYNLMLDSERSGITVRKTIHKGVWVDDLNIEERHAYSNPVNVVKMSGIVYSGGSIEDVCPIFSEAPGNAPKVYGREMNYDRLILDSQANLNIRCGRALAKHTAKYSAFDTRFINDGSFTIAPQELFPSNIEAGDNNRGLALTTRLIPRRVSRTFDHESGYIDYQVGFEPETDGPAGATVDLPCNPPAQVWPAGAPAESIDTSAGTVDGFLLAWSDLPGGALEAAASSIGSISLGTAVIVYGSNTNYVSVAALSTTQVIICYYDGSNGVAKILDISGTTITVTPTAANPGTTFNSGATSWISVAALSSTKAIVTCRHNATGAGRAYILDVSGSTITPGSAAAFSDNSALYTSVCRLTATRAIVSFRDDVNVDGRASILNVSGSTITPTAAAAWSGAEGVDYTSICSLDSATAVIAYRRTTNPLKAVALTSIDASSFSVGTLINLDATDNGFDNVPGMWFISPIDTTRVIVGYQTDNSPFIIKAIAASHSAGTLTPGSIITISPSTGYDESPATCYVGGNRAVIAYGQSAQARIASISISGTTLTDNNDDVIFRSGALTVGGNSICRLRNIA